MTATKILTFALTLAFLAGCAGSDESTSTTTDPTTTGTTTGVPGNNTGGPAANGTITEYSCTALAGGEGSGFVGAGGQYVGGCPFGAAESDVLFAEAQLPTGCSPYHTPPNGGPTDAQPASVGTEYPAGTNFSMFCGPGGIQLTGKIFLQEVLSA
jgi:hypothetical protein